MADTRPTSHLRRRPLARRAGPRRRRPLLRGRDARARAAADHLRRVRPRDPRDRRRAGVAGRRRRRQASAILCGTVPEWPLADFGALGAGATVVPVYHTNSPEECEYVLSHSGRRRCSCSRTPSRRRRSPRSATTLPELEHVVVLTGEAEGAITLADLRAARRRRRRRRSRASAPRPSRPRTRPRSSTRPARPARRRAACSSHANLLYTADAYIDRLELRDVAAGHLPVPAAGARAGADGRVRRARHRRHARVLERRHEEARRGDRARPRPTHIPTVPRLLEKIHTRVVGQAAAAGGAKAAIFTRALATGEKVAQGQARGPQGQPDRPRCATRSATSSR